MRRQSEGDGAERRPKSAGGQRVCERPKRRLGPQATLTSDGEETEKQERRQVGSGWVRTVTAAALPWGARVPPRAGSDWAGGSRRVSRGAGPGLGVGGAGPKLQAGRARRASAASGSLQPRVSPVAVPRGCGKAEVPGPRSPAVVCGSWPRGEGLGGFPGSGAARPVWPRLRELGFRCCCGQGPGRVLLMPLYL